MKLGPTELLVMLSALLMQFGWIIVLAIILIVVAHRKKKG